jgi:hypothetical protein
MCLCVKLFNIELVNEQQTVVLIREISVNKTL